MLTRDRNIVVHWEGRDRPLEALVDLEPNGDTQEITIRFPDARECAGTANMAARTWQIRCGDGRSATGTFTPLGRGKGSTGEGVDSDGNKVFYKLLPVGAS